MRPRKNPIHYLKFLFQAVNQHGVHSPFVFRLLTRSLYKPSMVKGDRAERILFKCISYFGVSNIKLPAGKEDLRKELEELSTICMNTAPFDLVYSEYPSAEDLEDLLPCIHNDTIYLVNGIRDSHNNLREWELLKKFTEVRVSMDFFSCGLIFFRREQVEQHFKIRR